MHEDGDYLINILQTSRDGDLRTEGTYVHPSAVTMENTPTPTTTDFLRPPQIDDKNRRFRAGDIVSIRSSINGRQPYIVHVGSFNTMTAYPVIEDETPTGFVELMYSGLNEKFHHTEVELITPVEAMRPYYLREAPQCYELLKLGNSYPSAIFFKHRLEDAFEAAKKACDLANDAFGYEP